MNVTELDRRYKNDPVFHELVKRMSWAHRNSQLSYQDFRDAANFAEFTDRFVESAKQRKPATALKS